MSQNLIKKILAGTWVNPDNNQTIKLPIEQIIIGENASDFTISNKNILLICDNNTYQALGKKIESQTSSKRLIVFDNDLKPNDKFVNKIIQSASDIELIIAVGSGTINDLCKYASYQLNIPYVIYATAPSMNGYCSANASITIGGHKKTLPAHLPKIAIFDSKILAKAPIRLIQSGLGDSLCRSTSQSDWLLSHLLLDTKYMTAPFELLKQSEKKLFERPSTLIKQDISAITTLSENLILSGIGMYIANGSHPASQGEHMIAHYVDMKNLATKNTYHGEEIGVTTLYMAKLQEALLSTNFKISIPKKSLNHLFNPKVIKEFEKEYSIKTSYCSEHLKQNINFKKLNYIKNEITKISISSQELKQILIDAECKTTPEELGWSKDLFHEASLNAAQTRSRFTFLDLQN